jgi:hypothetical protein
MEPFAYLPDRVHLELGEVDLVLDALELMVMVGHGDAHRAIDLYHAILGRLWGELGDLFDDDEGT